MYGWWGKEGGYNVRCMPGPGSGPTGQTPKARAHGAVLWESS